MQSSLTMITANFIPVTVLISAYVFATGLSLGSNCYNALGDDNQSVQLTCDTPGRTTAQVTWLKDNIPLDIDGDKYSLNSVKDILTIRNIVPSDEGNYSCSYTAGQSQRTEIAGCLLVYGKAMYASCISTTSNCRDNVMVSNEGIATFDLRLTFSTSGGAGQIQRYIRTTVKRGADPLLTVTETHTIFIHTKNRHWTIEGNNVRTRVALLHNVVASDRGEYRIITELIDPATGSVRIITKRVFVTALECDSPPHIQNGNVSTSGIIVSSTAQYSCNDGYLLAGNDSLTCTQRGSDTFWSGTTPSCIISDVPMMFQLQIGPTDDCTSWNGNKSKHFLDAVKEQISAGITSNYNCSHVRLTEIRLYCFKYPNYVTVRGYIRGSDEHTADEMLQCMEIWRSKSSTAILTDTKILNINKECKMDALCWNEAECQPPPRVQPCQCNCCNCCNDGLNTTNVDISTDQ